MTIDADAQSTRVETMLLSDTGYFHYMDGQRLRK